jgi:DNA invertase Pin-like site-specific DNA recombinase
MKKAVAYYRVSTPRQGISGLGLAAQKVAVYSHVRAHRLILAREYKEVESGKDTNRPRLKEALNYCKHHKTLLLIAKLDRLSRSVAFVATLLESDIKFVAVDRPNADEFEILMDAVFAQRERKEISRRTKAALQEAKKKGVKLGKNGKRLAKQNKKKADQFARKMLPILKLLKRERIVSLERIAAELNRRQVPTYRRGCRWHKATVFNLLARIEKLITS